MITVVTVIVATNNGQRERAAEKERQHRGDNSNSNCKVGSASARVISPRQWPEKIVSNKTKDKDIQ